MFYLNDIWKKQRLGAVELLHPNTYYCSTIADFETNRGVIRPTWRVWPFGVCFFGRAVVQFGSPVTYACHPTDYGKGVLHDSTSSIEVGLWWLTPGERRRLEDELRLYDATIVFHPKQNRAGLFMFETHGPASSEGEDEETVSRRLALA